MPPLPSIVPATWVTEHPDVVLVDVRWYPDERDGYREYLAGHLPGAVFADLDRDLAGPPTATGGRHPLPPPASFAAAMSRLGIGADDTVIAYDQGPGAIAARLVWMLRATGHPAALLDGGLAGWSGALETGEVTREPRDFPVRPWPADRLADIDEVARVAASGEAVVIDARDAERFRGEVEPIDPRAGHIPGAVNVAFAGNVDADGRFLPEEALRERFADAGVTPDRDVVVYCGSGVTACHDVLALESLGLDARLFPGSWSAWSADPDRPAATGDADDR